MVEAKGIFNDTPTPVISSYKNARPMINVHVSIRALNIKAPKKLAESLGIANSTMN